MTCGPCREQILAYLYDLLEPAEARELEAHVQSCATCQEVMKSAQEQKGLLSEAVKSPNEDIVFKAPAQPAVPVASMPVEPLMPGPARRPILFSRWVMAAAALFVIFTLGLGFGGAAYREHQQNEADALDRLANARRDLAKTNDALNDRNDRTQKEIVEIQKALDALITRWKKDEDVTRMKLEKDRVQLIVKGPKVAVAGAFNNYDVAMSQQSIMNFQQNPVFKNLSQAQEKNQQQQPQQQLQLLNSRVIDTKTNKVVYEQKVQLNQDNRGNLKLPPDLPIKPSDDLALEFETLDPEGKSVFLRDNLKLVFPEYVTHLATDRPMYRPGDTMRFRSLTLERFSLKPAQQDFHLLYRVHNAKNEVIFKKEIASQAVADENKEALNGPDGRPLRGLGAGEFKLPENELEGIFTLSVSEMNERFNEERRTFQVRHWPNARYHKEVTFHRTAYAPGDQVQFRVRVIPIAAKAALGVSNVTASVYADGQKINDVLRPVGSAGQQFEKNEFVADFQFTLPAHLARGVCIVAIDCEDQNQVPDRTVRTVPILMRDLLVEFFPEGGDLITGVPNRVYFQARTPAGKPAAFEGVVLDDRRQEVARIQTLADEHQPGIHQGLGSFTFTPQPKRRYHVRIESPIGVDRQFNLPVAKSTGVTLHVPQGVIDNEIPVVVHSARSQRELLIGAYCRGRMLDNKMVKAGPDLPIEVTLRPQAPVGGVYRITVFEKVHENGTVSFRPVAERLVFRKNQTHVDVAIAANRSVYEPGQTVELQLQAKNEKRQATPAVAMVAVIDSAVARIANNKTDRSMPTHFLLTTEIRNPEDLENADAFLGDHPRAADALDLLLGTQGWRRFAEQDPIVFAQKQQQSKAPGFLANSVAVPQLLEFEQKHLDALDQGYVAQALALNRSLAEKEKDEMGPLELRRIVHEKIASVQIAENEVENVRQRVSELQAFLIQFGLGGVLLTLLFLGFFLISAGLRRLSEGGTARPWFVIGAALLGLLFLASVIGTFTFMGDPLFEDGRDRRNQVNVWGPIMPAVPQAFVAPPEPLPNDAEILDEREHPPTGPAKNEFQQGQRGGFLDMNQNNDFLQNQIWNNKDLGQVPAAQEVDLRTLRQEGNYHSVLERQLGRRVQLPPANDPSVVRVYAHVHKPAAEGEQLDFAENVYWHPALILEDGSAKLHFDLGDSVTRYDVIVLSHTLDGRVGANRTQISAALPIRVALAAPREIAENDKLSMPVDLSNGTAKDVAGKLRFQARGMQVEGENDGLLSLKAMQSIREYRQIQPTILQGEAALRVVAKVDNHVDAVERRIKVAPAGFPVRRSVSGILDNGSVEHNILLPEDWLPGSLEVKAHLYPATWAEVRGAINSLLREPALAFEEQASLHLANVMLLQAMKHDAANGKSNWIAEKKARDFLKANAPRLAAFESSAKNGFRWYPGDASADARMSAYGLQLLREHVKLGHGDSELLTRTQEALLEIHDKTGKEKKQDLLTRTYLAWVLGESGVRVKFDALDKEAKKSNDPYLLGLTALTHLERHNTDEAIGLLRQLAAMQVEGEVPGAKTSVTGSRGRDLNVETTALAVLAWSKADRPNEFGANVQSGIKWLGRQRQDAGSYGGTQATILALKAMLAHAQKNPRQIQNGDVEISMRNAQPGGFRFRGDPDGNGFAFHRAQLRPNASNMITLQIAEAVGFAPGNNMVQLNLTNVNTIPYTLTWTYRTSRAPVDAKSPFKISTRLDSAKASVGDVVKLHAMLENVSANAQGTTVAILGLPAGLSLENTDQLNKLAKSRISAWELRGRELVVYWRELPAGAKVAFDIDLECKYPGVFHGPASQAYAVYDSEHVTWHEPLRITIAVEKK